MGILKVLFQKLILSMVIVFQEIQGQDLIQPH